MTRTTNPVPMEAHERPAKDDGSKDDDPLVLGLNPDVGPGTLSTADASLGVTTGYLQDASVISAITDHASLEGTPLQPPLPIEGTNVPVAQVDTEVPKQVILPEDGRSVPAAITEATATSPMTPVSCTSPPPPASQTLVATTLTPEMESIVSTSVLPDTPKARGPERTILPRALNHPQSTSSEDVRRSSTPIVPASDETEGTESDMDDYIRSPEVQNAIVERSPGSRYVRFMEKLGSGASKDVYRAYDTQEGIEVAWNVVTLSGVPRTERNRIINEVRLLERLHHQNIISFHGSWVNRERQEINFVTEILSAGSLKSFIKKVQVIRWKIAKRWATQILHGLAYLHSQDPPVIHRDLKCDNLFINGTSGDLRIGDLGLSTVHRNGKVLSVLGTPEFMAPDMYEEAPYDEKVDIYAFGLCMLEIFTKEIPYSECRNPAQIYKKVSAGEYPEVLSRLESRHAREFVMLCLGYRDENGKYIRPDADELLTHPFLDKRANDDDEVIVERPIRERIIQEANESSGTSPNGGNHSQKEYYSNGGSPHFSGNPAQAGSAEQRGQSTELREATSTNSTRQHNRMQSTNSLDDDGNDHFDEMPESEINMRKVKVLSGRGQELLEDDSVPLPSAAVLKARVTEQAAASSVPSGYGGHNTQVPNQAVANPLQVASPADAPPADNYLVAAAVIGDEAPDVRPYADDILKLVVTLPVEGQTQNVQFDFHLVRDDPVQVAKEMVQELRIPLGAVLEISETISALACSARMKQDSHNLRMQQNAVQSQPQGSGAMPQASPPVAAGPQTGGNTAPETATAQGHGQPYAVQNPSPNVPPVQHQHPVEQATMAQTEGGQIAYTAHLQQGQQQAYAVAPPSPAAPAAAHQPQHAVEQTAVTQPEATAYTSHQQQGHVAVSPVSPHATRMATRPVDVADMAVPFAGQQAAEVLGQSVSADRQQETHAVGEQLGLSDDDDEDIQAELRKLEENYERNLERAKKVFDSRMVNLQRSQKEKEKEYLKTLEKHEKERVEFEKRRAQENEQQQRRLEQLEKEKDRKIESLKREAQMQNSVPVAEAPSQHLTATPSDGAIHVDEGGDWQHAGTPYPSIGTSSRNVSMSSTSSLSPSAPVDHKESHPLQNGRR